MFQYSIGLTALRGNQFAIDSVAHNIANANTPGFHRREVMMSARADYRIDGRIIMGGMDIDRIRSIRDGILEASLTNSVGETALISQQLQTEQTIESLFASGTGSLHERFAKFFTELSQLSTDPNSISQRSGVLFQASQLSDQFRSMSSQLASAKNQTRVQIEQEVKNLNFLLQDLSTIESRMRVAPTGHVPNDLIDQRDQVVNQIAEIMGVNRNELVDDGLGLNIGGGRVAIGMVATQFEISNQNGELSLSIDQIGDGIIPGQGRLASLMDAYNNTFDHYQSQLDKLAQQFIREMNQSHAKGIGSAGPFQFLSSNNPVTRTDIPLSQAGLPFPVEAGDLYLNVTDASGNRQTTKIAFDPETQSLADLASAISATTGVQAVVDAQTGQLNLFSNPGYKFDFTGQLETIPRLTTFTGTSTPVISGQYSGSDNSQWRVEIVGSGEVGVANNLLARVFDASGGLVKELNIGVGYEAGQPLTIADGVSLQFNSGTVVGGDEFTTDLVANSDTGQLLSALGLNSLFNGHDAYTMVVNSEITSHPDRLATAKSIELGDTTNLLKMVNLQTDLTVDGKASFEQFLGNVTTEIGSRVRITISIETQLQQVKADLEKQRDAVSGVDLNEEMIQMSRYQKAYEASTRIFSTIDAMFNDLINILG